MVSPICICSEMAMPRYSNHYVNCVACMGLQNRMPRSIRSRNDFSQETSTPEQQDHNLCKEAFEVLTMCLVLNPRANEALTKESVWPKFITPSRYISCAHTHSIYCSNDWRPFKFLTNLLIEALDTVFPQNATNYAEYFKSLCRTLCYGSYLYGWPLPVNNSPLTQEIARLRKIGQNVKETGNTKVREGHRR